VRNQAFHTSAWKKIASNKYTDIDRQWIQNMSIWDDKLRPTPAQVLSNPYFDNHSHVIADDIVNNNYVDMNSSVVMPISK